MSVTIRTNTVLQNTSDQPSILDLYINIHLHRCGIGLESIQYPSRNPFLPYQNVLMALTLLKPSSLRYIL